MLKFVEKLEVIHSCCLKHIVTLNCWIQIDYLCILQYKTTECTSTLSRHGQEIASTTLLLSSFSNIEGGEEGLQKSGFPLWLGMQNSKYLDVGQRLIDIENMSFDRSCGLSQGWISFATLCCSCSVEMLTLQEYIHTWYPPSVQIRSHVLGGAIWWIMQVSCILHGEGRSNCGC